MEENRNKFLESRHPIFVEEIDWQDEYFGVSEGTIEYTTEGNYTINVTYKLTLEVNLDGIVNESVFVEEIYVENVYGNEVELNEEEFEAIEDNFKELLTWE